MAISFNGIPTTLRVPFAYVEFDNSKANQGPVLLAYRALIMGQMLSAGTATANIPVQVTSSEQAKTLFGAGSMLAHMFEKWFLNNEVTEVWALPLADNGSGVQSTGTLTFTGPASANGTISLYLAGRLVQIGVESGDTADEIATAVAAAITADSSLPFSAAEGAPGGGDDEHIVTLTHKHKGAVGLELDVRFNYQSGEAFPAGVDCTVSALASGATNPVLTTALSNISNVWYHIIAFPWLDATSLSAIEADLASRFGPLKMIDGFAVAGSALNFAGVAALGNTRNSPHVSISHTYKSPAAPYEYAAAIAANLAYYGNIDPARPFQTLELKGLLPVKAEDEFEKVSERNLLLFDGISTNYVDDGGLVRIEQIISTYKTNPVGADDASYLYANTLLTLMYLRYSFRTYFATKYPRHKLANDGTRFGPGQAVMTPSVGRAECYVLFRQWEELGLVENFDQFKADLIVERNASNVNRLDFYIPPDLINQLNIVAAQIGFRN